MRIICGFSATCPSLWMAASAPRMASSVVSWVMRITAVAEPGLGRASMPGWGQRTSAVAHLRVEAPRGDITVAADHLLAELRRYGY